MTAPVERPSSRKFAIEILDNGWLLKITEGGGATFIGRKAYLDIDAMISDLRRMLMEEQKGAR